jgi:FecR-like protein
LAVSENDEHLFDGTGSPDPDVARLERLLRPLGRADLAPVAARPRRRGPLLVAALATAAAAVMVAILLHEQSAPPSDPQTPAVADGPRVHDAERDASFAAGEWVDAGDEDREILIGDVGRVRLAAQSRLQVRHVSDDTTRLYLARGLLEASVSADARPRFFQVDTDAARCVDLGCRYTLEAGEDGVATVRVLTGQVAFEAGSREVFVPAGASCVARKDRGPGTPRFDDARAEVASAFDAYDAAPAEKRRDAALAALAAVRNGRDTLPAWHLLQDADADVVRAAHDRLETVAGRCDDGGTAPSAKVRAAWKEYLEVHCW